MMVLLNLAARSLLRRRVACSSALSIRFVVGSSSMFSSETYQSMKGLNEDNMLDHHVDHESQTNSQEWTMFHGKIPVLTSDVHKNPADGMLGNEGPRTSVLMELHDKVGILHDVLRFFWKYDINVTRIESRPAKSTKWGPKRFDFFVDFDGSQGDPNVDKLLTALKPVTNKLLVLDEKEVR
jgi:hypothetical protein